MAIRRLIGKSGQALAMRIPAHKAVQNLKNGAFLKKTSKVGSNCQPKLIGKTDTTNFSLQIFRRS